VIEDVEENRTAQEASMLYRLGFNTRRVILTVPGRHALRFDIMSNELYRVCYWPGTRSPHEIMEDGDPPLFTIEDWDA
jgi:hypothetical protein